MCNLRVNIKSDCVQLVPNVLTTLIEQKDTRCTQCFFFFEKIFFQFIRKMFICLFVFGKFRTLMNDNNSLRVSKGYPWTLFLGLYTLFLMQIRKHCTK